ncbi:hypothetical protein ZIOFF_006234 [Zingiber officinale]|uniref:Glycolipid transfer protein domain-containing protein n=1 Tax=Zingiber officinale TaxID=94328 RepID=A0A8J5LS68_ZINOF|nr:hypothetical protein ZIOFF_006234 [Zingiber officinale]
MAGTVFTPLLEGMKNVKSENGIMLTKPFLDVCKSVLPILDNFGAALAIVKSDIGGNITYDNLSSAVMNSTIGTEKEIFQAENRAMISHSFQNEGGTVCCLFWEEADSVHRLLQEDRKPTKEMPTRTKRLENKYNSDPPKFEHLYSMVQMEVDSKTAKGSSSCTNGLLWLTRVEVGVELKLVYCSTLQSWQGLCCNKHYGFLEKLCLSDWTPHVHCGSLFTLLPANAIVALGLAIMPSPNIAKLVVTPPVVGSATLQTEPECMGAMDFQVDLFRNLLDRPEWTMTQVCNDSYSKTLKKWHGWLASSSFSVAIKLIPDRKKFMELIGGSGNLNADIEQFCKTFAPLLAENHKFLASVGLDDMKAS